MPGVKFPIETMQGGVAMHPADVQKMPPNGTPAPGPVAANSQEALLPTCGLPVLVGGKAPLVDKTRWATVKEVPSLGGVKSQTTMGAGQPRTASKKVKAGGDFLFRQMDTAALNGPNHNSPVCPAVAAANLKVLAG